MQEERESVLNEGSAAGTEEKGQIHGGHKLIREEIKVREGHVDTATSLPLMTAYMAVPLVETGNVGGRTN